MITPFTNFESGLGPGVIATSDSELSPGAYDDAGLIEQARRNIRIDDEMARKLGGIANDDAHERTETDNDYLMDDESYDDDVEAPHGYIPGHEVIDIHNELESIAYRTRGARQWFPTLRQLGTPPEELEPLERLDRDDIMTLFDKLGKDADRFQVVAEVILRDFEISEVEFDRYRGRDIGL